MHRRATLWLCLFLISFLSLTPSAFAQVITATQGSTTGTFVEQTFRPLRYQPVGTDFVIESGKEFFNRPLYGGNTAFRVDAGDKPEFVLYLPGRGGNLRFGFKTSNGARWLHDANKIVTRYRPGSMVYEIHDSLLGNGFLALTVLALYEREGLLVRAELQGTSTPIELVWAYGGVNGQRGRRDGDIGTENIPISQYFQFKTEFARANKFSIEANSFTLESKAAKIVGVMPLDSTLSVADGNKWTNLSELLSPANDTSDAPVVIGKKTLAPGRADFLALQRIVSTSPQSQANLNESLQPVNDSSMGQAAVYKTEQLPEIFEATENSRRTIAEKVVVETPDSFLNRKTESSIGQPFIEIVGPAAQKYEVEIVWTGKEIEQTEAPKVVAENTKLAINFGRAKLIEVSDLQSALQTVEKSPNSFSAVSTSNFGHRTIFAKVQQGAMSWVQPLMFELRPAFEILAKENQDANSLRFTVRNNTRQPVDKSLEVVVNGRAEKVELRIPAFGETNEVALTSKGITTGSNSIKIDFGQGVRVIGIVQNWKIKSANSSQFETINLTPVFNDKLMAGSTNQMQSRFINGEVVVTYTNGSTEKLSLENPTNWWPIDQDYMIDDYAFRRPETIPPRVDLRTGNVRIIDLASFKGKGRKVPGGAATVLDLPLEANKELKSLTVRALANEVIIGLMSATLVRPR